MAELEQGALGYSRDDERYDELEQGIEPAMMLSAAEDYFPPFDPVGNPADLIPIMNQGGVGSCQGQMLSKIFQICYYRLTGVMLEFSASCGYYKSQEYDGIRGDRGSTLAGGRKVATEHGMCLDRDWKYPQGNSARYDPRSEPTGLEFPYKLVVSKPVDNISQIFDAIDLGLPVGQGIGWNRYCNQEVVSTYRSGSAGGHATTLWLWADEQKTMVNNINSWGSSWAGDGVHKFTRDALRDIARYDRYPVWIIYGFENMIHPKTEPIHS